MRRDNKCQIRVYLTAVLHTHAQLHTRTGFLHNVDTPPLPTKGRFLVTVKQHMPDRLVQMFVDYIRH